MKILHTGDWHIGKLINGIHMTEDQDYVLKQLVNIVKEEKPDVLIISGDLYDRSIPPTAAVELLDETFSKIVLENKTKIIAISGNHDSPDRLDFGSKIFKDSGLHIIGRFRRDINPIVLEDGFGKVNFYPVPFADPGLIREIYSDKTINSYDSGAKAIIDNIEQNINYDERNICIFHGFLIGGDETSTSESERPLSIGGSEYINVEYFKKFNYVALGHLHKPQRVKYDYIRYAGSLLKYSFSEARHNKTLTIVEMDGEGKIQFRYRYLKAIRDMRVIRGSLKELTSKEIYSLENREDYIFAILTDRGELIDPIGELRGIYPNILKLEKEKYDRETEKSKTSAKGDFLKKGILELFCEFYENMSGEIFSDDKRTVMGNILNEINQKERNL